VFLYQLPNEAHDRLRLALHDSLGGESNGQLQVRAHESEHGVHRVNVQMWAVLLRRQVAPSLFAVHVASVVQQFQGWNE